MRDSLGQSFFSILLFRRLTSRRETERLELNFIIIGLLESITMEEDNKILRCSRFKMPSILLLHVIKLQA